MPNSKYFVWMECAVRNKIFRTTVEIILREESVKYSRSFLNGYLNGKCDFIKRLFAYLIKMREHVKD
jgi:hypothetical protein